MRKLLILMFAAFMFCSCSQKDGDQKLAGTQSDDKIHIYCTPDLYKLVKRWSDEFCRSYPDKNLLIAMTTEETLLSVVFDEGALCFISEDYANQVGSTAVWDMVVAREIIIPIVSSKNPYISELREKGITAASLKHLLESDGEMDWGSITGASAGKPVHYYQLNRSSILSLLEDFAGVNSISYHSYEMQTSDHLVQAIETDPLSLGFCTVTDVYDIRDKGKAEVTILPIDRNLNGRIDQLEAFYDNEDDLYRGVWTGKYPSSLVRNVYTISAKKPTGEIELGFLNWVLSDGQQKLRSEGLSELLAGERVNKAYQLYEKPLIVETEADQYAMAGKRIYIISAAAILVFIVIGVLRSVARRKNVINSDSTFPISEIFDESSVGAPAGLYYDTGHTWAIMEKDGLVKIGIDDFLQHLTGPITSVKLMDTGKKVKKGDKIISIIQEGKKINICSPVSGTIMIQNEELRATPSYLNNYPFSNGWIYMIKPSNWLMEIQLLFFANEYKEWIKTEFSRFKDFLTMFVKHENLGLSQYVMQDGGALKNGILKDLGPEYWEDFQTNFMDKKS